jgi:hypothetical protein
MEFFGDFVLREKFLQTSQGSNFLLYISVDGQQYISDRL